jgi:hypothetical protein
MGIARLVNVVDWCRGFKRRGVAYLIVVKERV